MYKVYLVKFQDISNEKSENRLSKLLGVDNVEKYIIPAIKNNNNFTIKGEEFSKLLFTIEKVIETDEIRYNEIKNGDFELQEMTTSASSGSFEMPLFYIKKDKKTKMENNIIEQIVQNKLFKKFVLEATYNSKAAKTTEKNKKNTTTFKNNITTVATQASTNKDFIDSKNRRLTDDEKIEARQGGMEDIEYDSISDEQQQKIEKQIKKGDNQKGEISGAKKSDTANNMIDAAKKRKNSRDKNTPSTFSVGDDVEMTDTKNVTKKLGIMEDVCANIRHKKYLGEDKLVVEFVNSKVPEKFKNNGKKIKITDCVNNTYIVECKNGIPFILKKYKDGVVNEQLEKFDKLLNYNVSTKKSKINPKTDLIENLNKLRKNES